MSVNDTFFTVIGCMDGRCVDPVEEYGRRRFFAHYADTITEPGIVALLSQGASHEFLENLKNKIMISLNKHKSRGIVIDGHAECAGDPVSDDVQKDQIKKSVEIIKQLVDGSIPVVGVFIKPIDQNGYATWSVEEVTVPTVLAQGASSPHIS